MGAIPATARPSFDPRASAGPPPPDPGLLETLGAGFRTARADTTGYEAGRTIEAFRPVLDALGDLGYDETAFFNVSRGGGNFSREGVMAAYRREKARGNLKGFPATPEEWEEQQQARWQKRMGRDESILARGNGMAGFAGGMAGAMTDPVNLMTLPFGGFGATIARRVASEAAIGMGIEAALLPTVAANREAQGRDPLTLRDAAVGVAAAGAGAAALRGGFELAPRALQGARGAFERSVAANWERLPEGLRQRWSAELPAPETPAYDILVADTGEALSDAMAEHAKAGFAVLRREAEIAQSSPFAANGASAALHPQLLAEAMTRILTALPATPKPAAIPAIGATRPSLARSTSIGSTVVPGGAEARFMARVRQAESGGSDTASNPRSSAMGRYQFTDGTWLAYFKRRFPESGLSDRDILARKGNGTLQDTLMRDLTADNRAFLQRQGEAVSEGNLYLVHFAGQGGAKKLFEADPGESALSVLGKGVVDANPHLRGMTAQGVIDWAHRSMGAKPAPRAGARAEVRDDIAEAGALQAEIDAITARMAELERGREVDGDPLGETVAGAAERLPEVLPPISAPDLHVREADAAPVDAVAALLEPLRALVADRTVSLNKPRQLAELVGAPLDRIAAAMERLADAGEIAVNRKTGKFMRKASAPMTTANTKRPRTLIEWIAERGGANDFGGELRAMGIKPSDRRFGKRIIRATEQQTGFGAISGEGDYGLDTLFATAVSEGYFPEYYQQVTVRGEHVDGPDILLEAIREELFGSPRYSEEEFARLGKYGLKGATEEAYGGIAPLQASAVEDMAPDELAYWRDEATGYLRQIGFEEDFSPEIMDELVTAMLDAPEGVSSADAVYFALNALGERNQAEAFAYGDAAAYEAMDYGTDTGLAEGFPAGREAPPAGADSGRWEPADPYAEAGGVLGAGAREADGDAGARLADLAPEDRAPFLDPDSEASKVQAESLDHDARVAAEAASQGERFFAAIRDLPDTEESEQAIAALRAQVWDAAAASGNLEDAITRFDEARDRWQEQFKEARAAADLIASAQAKAERDVLASAIVAKVQGGAQFALPNPVRGRAQIYGPGTVRAGIDGGIEVIEGRKWVALPDSYIGAVAAEVGARPPLDLPDLTDPAIAERMAQEVALRAEAPMRASSEQDGTMGLGLFDAADQPTFRLDVEGDEVSLSDILADLDAEAADIKTIRDCM